MTKVVLLNGQYKLYAYENGTAPKLPKDIQIEGLDAVIPENVETTLMRAGLLPDIYQGTNVEYTRKFELYDWWYVRDFQVDDIGNECDAVLMFDGVDTYAEYFLNGKKIGESDNALISHEFYVNGLLKKGNNQLAVRIESAVKRAENFSVSPNLWAEWECFESLRCRKPAHSYGWDICPRVVSAGIWRSVRLEYRAKMRIEQVYLSTVFAREDLAGLCFHYELKLPAEIYRKCKIVLSGSCGENSFFFEYPLVYKAATKFPYIKNPLLWWPIGMGVPNLYDVSVRLFYENGELIDEKILKFGIRHVQFHRTDFAQENGFSISINNEPVFCKGANWVPLDVLHAKDADKYEECVLNYVENNSNMIRVWGGGVYEDERFFELCDKYGLMVWQDMMLACYAYPQDEEFGSRFKREVETFIKRVRNHSSIILYCGSNETDWCYFCIGRSANEDVLTRKIIPEVIRVQDPYRIYYPSTPLFGENYTKENGGRFLVDLKEIEDSRTELSEEHYWWHRDDYETYENVKHCFVGEIGYSGCPNIESLQKFLSEESLKNGNFLQEGNWKCHNYSSDGNILHASKYYFGVVPQDLEDFVLSSQISQAEACKFLIEQTRLKKPYMTGILLWNMRDGWPAYNSSLIDYYGSKKLAYYYVQRAQQFTVFVFDKGLNGYICNDTLKNVSGVYKIFDIEENLLASGDFIVAPNKNIKIGEFKKLNKVKYFILVLEIEGKNYFNHFVNGVRPHNFNDYKKFLTRYNKMLLG